MAEPKLQPTHTIRGLVLPDAWDDDDRVTAVVIDATDWEVYQVLTSNGTAQLLELSNAWVEATGTVERVDGELVLSVLSFTRLADDYDPSQDGI